jgi:hypothetical protein
VHNELPTAGDSGGVLRLEGGDDVASIVATQQRGSNRSAGTSGSIIGPASRVRLRRRTGSPCSGDFVRRETVGQHDQKNSVPIWEPAVETVLCDYPSKLK